MGTSDCAIRSTTSKTWRIALLAAMIPAFCGPSRSTARIALASRRTRRSSITRSRKSASSSSLNGFVR